MSEQVQQEIVVEHHATAIIGEPVRREEDARLITGEGRFVDDLTPPNCLYLSLVRSIHASAKITSIDVAKAKALPGVVSAMTGEELRRNSKPIHDISVVPEMKSVVTYPLAVDRVRFVGEPVVAIVATSREIARDALELVEVGYERLPVVVDAEKALAADSALLYEEWGDNVMLYYKQEMGDVDRAFESADAIVKERIAVHRHSPAPIETNCYLATYDVPSGLTFWAATQNAHILRTVIVETLGLGESRVRVIEPDVGGGFGGKMPVHPEEVLVCYFAYKLHAPVKFTEERMEHLLASHQAREQVHLIEAAVREDGKLLAIRDKIIGNAGSYFPTTGLPSLITASRFVPGCYKLQNYRVEVVGAATNKPPYGAYRGYGKDAANYVIEKLMNAIAYKLKLDPIQLRMKNIINPEEFPYRSATGALYDSGDYRSCLQKCLEMVGYDRFRDRQQELRRQGKYLGLGVSLVLEPAASHFPDSVLVGQDGATVRLEPSGRVSVFTGVTSTGSGTTTAFAQIAADELGVRIEDVHIFQGDTESVLFGYGMWASRGLVLGGNSILLAARRLRERILKLAGAVLGADPEHLTILDGAIVRRDGPRIRAMSLREVASTFYMASKPIPPEIREKGLQETVYFMPSNLENVPDSFGRRNAYASYGNSACAAEVLVDIETGQVHVRRYVYVADAGRIVNPMLLEGQVHGGVIQGLGGAMYEENLYSPDGQPLATTFMDYLLPSALESPAIEVAHLETPSPFLPLGAKGAGEGPTESAYAVLSNAVEDALEPFEVRVRDLPLTPERIWRLLGEAKAKGPRSKS